MACMPLPEHADMTETLARAGAAVEASECHGLVCGVMSLDETASSGKWAGEVARELDPNNALASEALRAVEEMGEEIRRQLHDPELGFRILLPDEEEPLSARVEAMKRWCLGFGFGLSVAGLTDPDELPGDGAEIVRDIAEFARMELDDDSEDDEVAYAELVEYLRVGVLLIHAGSPVNSQHESSDSTRH